MPASWHLSRRALLRGVGAGLALPLLDAMVPGGRGLGAAEPGADAAGAPLRLALLFVPNGVNVTAWKPGGEGAAWQLSPTLQPLAQVKDDILVIGGLAHRLAAGGAGDHARSAATFLTGARAHHTNGKDIRVGVSVDQLAARHLGARTRLPSLELGLDKPHTAGNCDAGYSCAYATNLAWSDATTPVPKEVDPGAVFDRLFGAAAAPDGSTASPAERARARSSVLDLVAADARRLERRLGRGDQGKLDEFLTSVREVERRVGNARRLAADGSAPRPPAGTTRPDGIPLDPAEHMRLMCDLLVLAFRMDLTRVATVMVAREGSNRTFPQLGLSDGHHTLSHHGKKPEKLAALAKIDHFHVQQYAYLVERLKAVREGAGSLLDRCAVVFGAGISDPDSHSHDDLPVVVAGRGGGLIRPGRFLKQPAKTPMSNLYVSLLVGLGIPTTRFGDSTGPLAGLGG